MGMTVVGKQEERMKVSESERGRIFNREKMVGKRGIWGLKWKTLQSSKIRCTLQQEYDPLRIF